MSPPNHATPAFKESLYSKRSPPAVWKEKIRQACLNRARQRTSRSHNRGGRIAAQQIAQLELERYNASNHMNTGASSIAKKNHDDEGYNMSEEEWVLLLEEIEHELEEAAMDRQLQDQDTFLEDQIAYYEQLHENENDESMVVLCPVCQEARLVQTAANEIVCPNSMDGSCSMRLTRCSSTLLILKELLRSTIEHHSMACTGLASFDVDGTGSYIRATCTVCQGSIQLNV